MKAMKKIVSSILAVAMLAMSAIHAFAASELVLSDTTIIEGATENSFAKVTADEYYSENEYYLQYKSEGGYYEVTQTLAESIKAGTTYDVTVIAKPVSGYLYFRVGWDDGTFFGLNSDATASATDLGDGWYKYERTITPKAEQNTLMLIGDNAAEWLFDSISIVPQGGTTEHMSDSEFEKIAYDAETDTITSTSMNLPSPAKIVMGKEKVPANTYSLHYKAVAADGLYVKQNFTKALETGTYTLTFYTKGTSSLLWYYHNDWDSDACTHTGATTKAVYPNGWTKHTSVFNIANGGDTGFFFYNGGADVEYYLDDFSLVDANGVNYIVDGGFGEVTVIGGETPDEPEVPTEKYVISTPVISGLTEDGKIQEGTVSVSATIKNNAMGDNFAPIMLVALYDGDALKAVGYWQQTVIENASDLIPADECGASIDVPAVTETSDYSIKVMFWNGFDKLMPLGVTSIVE